MKELLKKYSFIRKTILYFYHKFKNRHLVKFWFGSEISSKCQFEGNNMVCKNTSFIGNLGYASYIGPNSNLSAIIGRFTSIGPGCKYICETHPFKPPYVTTSPYFYSLDTHKNPQKITYAKEQSFKEYVYFDEKNEIANEIGSDCWLGANVTLIGGVRISDGAVVLAHAVVTKDVPPYAIVGGIPAKIIGYRYDEETIKLLLKIKWWNKDEQWFKDNVELLTDIDKFKNKFTR